MTPPRTRFAPSPTGDLHVGGAWAALASWAVARAGGGAFVVRVEDLDTPRVVAGTETRILEDLAWLGLSADEGPAEGGAFGPYRQSERAGFYEAALAELEAQGRVYPCDCSRADIARAASAPHPGEELVYPGTCRDLPRDRAMKRAPSSRLRVLPGDRVELVDLAFGALDPGALARAGDFVLRRADGVFAYHLAVAVDDLAMRMSRVVRGVDLLASTPRHLLLMELLASRGALPWAPEGGAPPRYLHVPMVVGGGGERLAKREGARSLRELRAAGARAEEVLGRLAGGLGLTAGAPTTGRELARAIEGAPLRFRREPWSYG